MPERRFAWATVVGNQSSLLRNKSKSGVYSTNRHSAVCMPAQSVYHSNSPPHYMQGVPVLRSIHRCRGIGIILVAVLIVTTGVSTRRAAAEPLPWRDKSTPFGMVTAVGNRVRTDEIDAYVGLLREAGVQWSREEIFWDKVQRDPGGPF